MELKVTPQELLSASGEFEAHNGKMFQLVTQIVSTVNGMKSSWVGDASMAYISKTTKLQDDISKLRKLIDEHVKDLEQIANTYSQAERQNQEIAAGLPTDVVQ